MKDWIITETDSIEFGDKRLKSRFNKILEKISNDPAASLPQCFNNHSELTSAYRFMNNEEVDFEKIMKGHRDATLKRLQSEDVILAVQDTTSLDYTKKKISEQLGHIENSNCRGILVHPTILFNVEGTCLGTIASEIWTRDIGTIRKKRIRSKPFKDKESYRWYSSIMEASKLAKAYPDKQIISVGDRESDIYELFYETFKLENRAELVYRASHNRETMTEDGEILRIEDRLDKSKTKGKIQADIAETPTRKARKAEFIIKYEKMELLPPWGFKDPNSTIDLTVVRITEKSKAGVDNLVEWTLLTTLEINNLEDVIKILNIYKNRWNIEVFFRTLKTACKVEEVHLQTMDRLLRLLSVYSIVTWRIMFLTKISREHPDLLAINFFEANELKVIIKMSKIDKDIKKLNIKEVIRMIAKFGGFLGRKSDKDPGPGQIWIGLRRLSDFMIAYEFFMSS